MRCSVKVQLAQQLAGAVMVRCQHQTLKPTVLCPCQPHYNRSNHAKAAQWFQQRSGRLARHYCGPDSPRDCCVCGFRTSIKDKAYPVKCPEDDCSCQLDLEEDVKTVFVTKKERREYAELLDIAALSCIQDKDRFYCPNQACSALYEFTNNKYAVCLLRSLLCM